MNLSRSVLTLVLGGLLSSCGGKVVIAPPPPPADIQLNVTAGADINPDRSGRPSPVVLRVFVLADAVAFDKASPEEISDRARDALAAALLGESRLLVRPGESQVLMLAMPATARYLAATAEFADALGSSWRTKVSIDPAAVPANGFILTVERNQVLLQPAR